MVDFLSELADVSGSSLPDFIRLVRGQTDEDPRPNKDLYELPTAPAAHLQDISDRWNAVVRDGVVPEWLPDRPHRQAHRPRNHGTIDDHLPQVWRHIRKGQKEGRYLIVRASLMDQ
nr:hypothetical protein PF009_g25928 [Phytophthora fragariae]